MRIKAFFFLLLFMAGGGCAAEQNNTHPASYMISFYQNVLSPMDGPRSSSYPTGSVYGKQAYNTYGFFVGTLLTAARLLQEYENPRLPLVKIYGLDRKNDPLRYNTYWWDEAAGKGDEKD